MDHQILRSHYVERRNKHKHWLKRRQFCQCCLSLRNSACFLSKSGKTDGRPFIERIAVCICLFFSWNLIAHTCMSARVQISFIVQAAVSPCDSALHCRHCEESCVSSLFGPFLCPQWTELWQSCDRAAGFFWSATPQRHATMMKPRRWCKRLAEEGVDEYDKIW